MVRIPSVVQILVAELLAVWGVSSFVMAVWNTVKPGSFGETATLRGIGNWVWFLIGIALLIWALREIFKPRVKEDSWFSFKTLSSSGGDYSFCSTHPSYVFLDLILVVVSAFLLWEARDAGVEWKNYAIMLGVSLLFPIARLFAWYVLGLRIEDKDESKKAWKPAAGVFIPFFLVFAVIGVMVALESKKQAKEIANIPVVDEQSFSNSREAFVRLVDDSKKQTGFVRLRAKQVSDTPQTCKNNQNIDYATVLADLGAGGDVLVVGSNYDRGGFDELVSKAKGNQGKPLEVVGKLREMPTSAELESWKAYCGMEKLPTKPSGGRWVLEMHEP